LGLNPLVQRVFKGLFDRNKTSFVSPFHVCRCSPHRRPVQEDGSGSVSAHLVSQVSVVEQRPVATGQVVWERALLQARRRFVGELSDNGRHSRALHCASALRWCKCRTLTAIGVDGVRTVERERARRTVDAARTRGERGFGGGCSCGRRRMTSRTLG